MLSVKSSSAKLLSPVLDSNIISWEINQNAENAGDNNNNS